MVTPQKHSEAELASMLHDAGIRPSAQRIAIMGKVADSRSHPSADEIYDSLKDKFPTLSLTTVYNSLHVLVETGLARELEIESGEKRYDYAIQPTHSHFRCRRCKRIFDMAMPTHVADAAAKGFAVEQTDVFFKGLCPDCQSLLQTT